MELRSCRYFLEIADCGNITKAAQRLHITQPTLSRQMRELEEELGVQLFDRKSHSIRLTREGELLKKRAEDLVNLADRTVAELSGEEEPSGTITIGGSVFRSSRYLAYVISAFLKKYPDVRFVLPGGNYDTIREKIDDGIVDFGVFMEPVDIGKYGTITLPVTEVWGARVPADSPAAKKKRIRKEDLAGKTIITPVRGRLQSTILEWLGIDGQDHPVHIVCDQQPLTAALVKEGGGISLDIDLGIPYEGLVFLPLDPPLEQTTALCWRKGAPLSPQASAFLSFLREDLALGRTIQKNGAKEEQ